jgi:hypothetical protein
MSNVQHFSCFLVPFLSHILFVVTSFFLLGFILTLASFSSFILH